MLYKKDVVYDVRCCSITASTVAWATLTPEDLWKLIEEETKKNFGFELAWYGFT